MGQVHIDADHQLKRPFGAFFHGGGHIQCNPPINSHDLFRGGYQNLYYFEDKADGLAPRRACAETTATFAFFCDLNVIV